VAGKDRRKPKERKGVIHKKKTFLMQGICFSATKIHLIEVPEKKKRVSESPHQEEEGILSSQLECLQEQERDFASPKEQGVERSKNLARLREKSAFSMGRGKDSGAKVQGI